jgi:hypothetical protein
MVRPLWSIQGTKFDTATEATEPTTAVPGDIWPSTHVELANM